MFLIDKYSPKSLSDFRYNKEIMNLLQYAATKDDIPHIILAGPEGSGKKVLAKFLLEEIYDETVHTLRKNSYEIGKKTMEMDESRFHIVIDATNTNREKQILQEIIKMFAARGTLNVFKTYRCFKTIVIYNVEKLSSNSQAALRRTMETYASVCRFIMLCDNITSIIEPLRSRCSIYTVTKPSMSVITKRLHEINIQENIGLSASEIKEIACPYMSRSIWRLDCVRLGCKKSLPLDDCFTMIINIIMDKEDCVMMFNDIIRQQIYDILITDLSTTEIISRIVNEIIDRINCPEALKQIITVAADAEYNAVHGRRESLHIDTVIWCIIKTMHEII